MKQHALVYPFQENEKTEAVCKEQELELTAIFESYYKRVYNYIYYRIHCHHTSEDLTSQVFNKIMLRLDTYSKEKSPFEVWLFAIVRNVVNDHFRSLKKQKLFSLDAIKSLVSKEKNPEQLIEITDTNNKLAKALLVLSMRERNLVALKFGADLKNKDIAEIMGISESNVGVILYRTMKKLKKEMEEE
ncbi:RNA polymerase, sigma-24 subunit, RpoE [Paenibacillus uliginis N3/975]|uniref:RNA polymerase, sigma-24 subunit, RpoE n=1 Tax=Paenibacillus uliginis N3/975 TaxID=1313296 RepID=A0A1X7HT28_9BACL|nr:MULTISPECIES: sigma-70 family RNA polymerase sigma factor [Paenibacillus]UNK18644.1 sigma-70 family RNA polymerase sigma factor [Paenibacillus sp. N3/727]SMF92453.1 RNA polymerase, sigma-24 subunit, RpoE [Paenibacillus uliginis N3/975]